MAKESTLILGNGFDLDLGLPTSYRNFVESPLWPVDNQMRFCSRLAQYLDTCAHYERWFDLELALARYAAPLQDSKQEAVLALSGTANLDYQFFGKLREALSQYIAQTEQMDIRKDSLAAHVIQLAASSQLDNILSFNYTNLNASAVKCGVRSLDYQHVHGGCADGSAILGISDVEKVREGYEFLYKTCSPYYQSTNVRYALQRSSLVIFFGHSLGPQDYHYFSDFFRQQSRVDMKEDDAKSIVIITRDEASRMDILKQLRHMNEGRINLLFDCNKLKIFKTAEDDTATILTYLAQELKAVHDKNVQKEVDAMVKKMCQV